MKNQACEKSSAQSDLFLDLAKKLLSVPKKEMDEKMKSDRKKNENQKEKRKRK